MGGTGVRLALVLISAWLLAAAILLAPATLKITGHEGDLIHTLDLVFRMATGDAPHRDVMSPLGVLTIWPIALFVEAGFGPGRAIRLAEAMVALVMLPMIWWAAWSRLSGALAYVLGIGLILLVTALVFGGTVPSSSVSMYYNRWAWALAALMIVVLVVPERVARSAAADGLLLGAVVAALVLIKVTYVIALAPCGLVALLHDRRGRVFLWALLSLCVCLALATLAFGGVEFWRGYLLDLLITAQSPLRPQPGETLGNLLGKPAFFPGTILCLLTIIFWRKTGREREGLLLLLLAPGFVYITYQNWGNDPKWLAVLAILLIALPNPEGAKAFWRVPARSFGLGLSVAALAMIAPSLINIGSSSIRHALIEDERFAPVFGDLSRADILVRIDVHRAPRTRSTMTGILFAEDRSAEDGEGEDDGPKVTMLNGEVLPDCAVETGLVGVHRQMALQLGAVEEAVGKVVLDADLLDSLWLFGPFERMAGGAPWYYGGTPGFDGADYVLVPLCPLSESGRRVKLEEISELGWELEEVLRTDLFILTRRVRTGPDS
ncbi:hypothetical protein [Algicella marina]|uniref:Glycosyltransferase RgtA/B/C/D-like domain-containing protein n=1 Tax=Algicella marina TaxID=2683284 RepID=A0A6P1T691_9RHOB|nr:hypothetical protein [Algicella marina]QHQ37223.1 hypothetical protein GO499_19555 [Algicella marina]